MGIRTPCMAARLCAATAASRAGISSIPSHPHAHVCTCACTGLSSQYDAKGPIQPQSCRPPHEHQPISPRYGSSSRHQAQMGLSPWRNISEQKENLFQLSSHLFSMFLLFTQLLFFPFFPFSLAPVSRYLQTFTRKETAFKSE